MACVRCQVAEKQQHCYVECEFEAQRLEVDLSIVRNLADEMLHTVLDRMKSFSPVQGE